uniref:Putative secreted protein n=1 Tax=Anopheles darlingi TaxID=43151 RepID=A0A2M4D7E8_ANODA
MLRSRHLDRHRRALLLHLLVDRLDACLSLQHTLLLAGDDNLVLLHRLRRHVDLRTRLRRHLLQILTERTDNERMVDLGHVETLERLARLLIRHRAYLVLRLLNALLRTEDGDRVRVLADTRHVDLGRGRTFQLTQTIALLAQNPAVVLARDADRLAGLRLEVHQDLAACLQHLVQLARHQKRQRLVLAARNLDVRVRLLHDRLARAQRFALAELVRVVLALTGRYDEHLRHDRAADAHVLRGR